MARIPDPNDRPWHKGGRSEQLFFLGAPVADLEMVDDVAKQEVDTLFLGASSLPPSLAPAQVAEAALRLSSTELESLVLQLAQRLQKLATEVESGREALLASQSAMSDVLQRMQQQESSWTKAQLALQEKDHAIQQLGEANARMRHRMLCKHMGWGQRSLPTAGEQVALDLGPSEWSAQQDSQHVWLVGELSSLQMLPGRFEPPPAAKDLMILGGCAAASRARAGRTLGAGEPQYPQQTEKCMRSAAPQAAVRSGCRPGSAQLTRAGRLGSASLPAADAMMRQQVSRGVGRRGHSQRERVEAEQGSVARALAGSPTATCPAWQGSKQPLPHAFSRMVRSASASQHRQASAQMPSAEPREVRAVRFAPHPPRSYPGDV
jgi:hypothetical protein